ncbi:MAG: serine/threonine-protein kinase [Cyanobacteriota bacterium]
MQALSKNYEIIKEIGRGGMGIVYLAQDKRLDRQVAIKVLQLDPNLDNEEKERVINRFYKEGKSLAQLSHPEIVSIFDIGESEDQYYMIMEFIEGKSLARLLQIKSHFSIDLVLSIGAQIASALSYIHEKGILHRDIKPGNIMLSENGEARLTDFGLAKIVNSSISLTQTGSLFGSLMYIPPEQALGSKTMDVRSDIYSLGITLYELLTGSSPFMDDTIAIIIRKVIEEEPPPPSHFIPEIPQKLDEIILKSVRKDPNERYQNVSEMELDLLKVIDDREKKAIQVPQNQQVSLGQSTASSFSGGSEENLVLSTIIQFLCLNNSSGKLTFKINKQVQGIIYIYEGNLTHVELGKLTGIDAITHMFCWKYARGEFDFDKEYQGEKLFYKSLHNVSVQQILKAVNERIDSCSFRKIIQEKIKDSNKQVSVIQDEIYDQMNSGDKVIKKIGEKLIQSVNIPLWDLIANTHSSEIESCGAFNDLIDSGAVATFINIDKMVPYHHLLHVVNLISKFTDKSIALKFVSEKKAKVGLSNAGDVSVKQLCRLSNMAYKEFNILLPEKLERWIIMKNQIDNYLETLTT